MDAGVDILILVPAKGCLVRALTHRETRRTFVSLGCRYINGSVSMPHRSMMELVADLHLEPLFQAHLARRTVMGCRALPRYSSKKRSTRSVDSVQELTALLQHLGVRADSAAMQCFALVDGATARAVRTIGDWMSYLPVDCVRSMVSDGWHWTT